MLRRESRPGSMFWRAVGRGASRPDQVCAGKPSSEWTSPYPDPKAGYDRHKLSFPACNMSQLSSSTLEHKYWDGAVYSQETEMQIMGEMVAVGNATVSASSSLPDLTPLPADVEVKEEKDGDDEEKKGCHFF